MKRFLFIIILFCFSSANAQTILSIDEALKIALKNNYDISIARNEGAVARTNNTAGNAGMLPDISLNASGNITNKNIRYRPDSATPYTESNLNSGTQGVNISLNWTLFDGGKMFITKERLSEVQTLGEIRFREQVLQTLSEVTASYYNVVKLKQQLASIDQTIAYNRERLKIAETGFNSGAKKKTDLLQAKIDLNVNLENEINQQTLILAAKRELTKLLAVESDSLIEVIDTIVVEFSPDKNQLQDKLYSKNSSILAFEKQLAIQRLLLKESYRSQLPRLDLSAGYYYSRLNEVGTSGALTQTLYPQVGFNFKLPVYQSGDLRRQVALSKLGIESAQYNLESLKLQVNTELLNALTSFENQKELLMIERENYLLAKENMEISLQRMRLGDATSLEVRIAQTDFEQSATRLTNFQYNLKIAETKLKQLLGEL